jgi:RNA polymerase sigma-70 factor (ECF subfamily)
MVVADDTAVELEQVFRAHYEFVWSLLRSLGASPDLADDVVQEVFILVARKLDSYEERGRMRPWLAQIARRLLADERKKRARATAREKAAASPVRPPDPETYAAQAERASAVDHFLDGIPIEQREIFVFVEIEGMSVVEAANIIEANANTAYSRLRTARRSFAEFANSWKKREVAS